VAARVEGRGAAESEGEGGGSSGGGTSNKSVTEGVSRSSGNGCAMCRPCNVSYRVTRAMCCAVCHTANRPCRTALPVACAVCHAALSPPVTPHRLSSCTVGAGVSQWPGGHGHWVVGPVCRTR